jgi:hypothetical protein
MGEGYAQSDPLLREMEKEAYLEGNIIFRDATDTGVFNLCVGLERPGEITMKEVFNKRHSMMSERLMERWGYKQPVNEEGPVKYDIVDSDTGEKYGVDQYIPGENLKRMQHVPFPVNRGGDEDEDVRAAVQQLADADAPTLDMMPKEWSAWLKPGATWQPDTQYNLPQNGISRFINLPKKVMDPDAHLSSDEREEFIKLKNDFPEYIASLEADPAKQAMPNSQKEEE